MRARNTATESTNKIHDDAVARSLGFSGGLVPGVDVYAYMTHLPVQRWGREFLERGYMEARFSRPVYDGDEVEVVLDDAALTLRDSRGEVCAAGMAVLPAAPHRAREPLPSAALPERPPAASADAFHAAPDFGSLEFGFHSAHAPEYLADVGETLTLYTDERIAHPGWLLRTANYVLSANVRLGPWIHVASNVEHHGLVHDGDRLSTRARVVDVFERKGHRFVTLDVAIVAEAERLVMRAVHTAIYEPRRAP